MANPFPSDWNLTSPKEDTAPPAKQLPFTIRTFSFRNALNYCASQILSRFSPDDDSSPPALERSSSTRDSTPPSTPITPGKYTTSPAQSFGGRAVAVVPTPSSTTSTSAQSKRQHSQDELRSLSDSQLGLQLAILLPERMCESPMPVSEEEKPSCPPQLHAPQGQRHQRMTLRQSEGPPGAIPLLDLDAAQEVDEASSDGAEQPQAEVSGGGSDNGGDWDYAVVRLNAAAVASRVASGSCSRGSSCELAGNAPWRCVAPRDLLFA
ncbi:uncharacterized protein LTHEOB_2948 [Lasiodiplodia theobromae]|uniref:Uncharacterized protein n=1 Tax=Lasiodiplodia theobromae TaxID=45133 RepID=A0A5N5CWX4_9PEZI|nr:uncharacterized protein LTHEOB_2948 [Lasiodiplodia theobromae]KAB2569816.1 hypothetical protein DBV05_g11510 [Lasiodiplodia theobromae]KAF4534973.1 hypothetical protein LTHEOB_2948 [Lasiodiplodia theobromae]